MDTENYKNILSNKYMRDTNYIIIKDTDDLEDLENQWNKFCSYMTVRQQRLSDDKSIEIWNMTNQQHYEFIKERLLSKLKEKDLDNKEITPNTTTDIDDDTKFVIDDLYSDFNSQFDSSFDNNLKELENYNEDSPVNIKDPISLELQDDPNNDANIYNQNSNMKIIGDIKGSSPEEKLKNLESEFIRFNSQSNKIKLKADDECRSLYNGQSNLERYNSLKSKLLNQIGTNTNTLDKESYPVNIKQLEESVNTIIRNDSFLSYCYAKHVMNYIEESNRYRKNKTICDLPYFTPQELIDLGVHGRDNYYGVDADTDGLTDNISISTWFDSYKDISMNHVFEDYRKEWINKLNELYSDYYDISDEAQLLARKQSILDLGWNPEIPFTSENRRKATDRVNKIFKETIPSDIFMDLDTVYDSVIKDNKEDIQTENVNSTDYEPVFLILTKGETPVISKGIKLFTKSEYSHASISFDPELEESYSYNINGFIKEPFSEFKDNVIIVFAFFAEKSVVNELKKTVYDFANHKTNFNLKIFFNKILHINHKISNNEYDQVCSTFVDTVLKSGGINIVGNQQIPTPADIYNGVKSQPNKIFEVYYGIATKYDGKKVKNQITYLLNNKDTLSINEACKDIKTARDAQIEWEKNNGFDPNEDWSKQTISNESSDIYYNDEIISEGDEFMLEFIQDIKNGVNPYSKKKFYHISFDENLDEKILKPRIPSWITRMKNEDKEKFIKEMEKTKNATKDYIGAGYEEYKTPRVCFSNSIEGCLNSIISGKDRMSLAGKQIHVYTPEKPIGEYKHKSNKSIKRDGDVFDANITNEMWVLEPVKVKYVGSIIVDKVLTEKLKKFANNKHRKIIKYIYKWHWFHKVKYNINTESSDILSINKEALPTGYTLRNATQVSFVNETKKFPIEFDDNGNLIIYKCRMGNISYGDEIDDSVQLLETYRNTSNIEGMKYELSKIWFIINDIEKRMNKKVDSKEYEKYVKHRATAMNIFKTNIQYVMKVDNTFNFAEYYNNTPFSDNSIKISNNTLKYSFKALRNFIFK